MRQEASFTLDETAVPWPKRSGGAGSGCSTNPERSPAKDGPPAHPGRRTGGRLLYEGLNRKLKGLIGRALLLCGAQPVTCSSVTWLMTNHSPRPESDQPDTPGGQPQERVEDRPDVGQVSPEEYPEPASGADLGGDVAGDQGPGESGQNYEPRGTSAGSDKGREG